MSHRAAPKFHTLLATFILGIAYAQAGQGRALLNAFSSDKNLLANAKASPPTTNQATSQFCPTLNDFGYVYPQYAAGHEILKLLQIKFTSGQSLSTTLLQSLNDQFQTAMSHFRTSFAVDLKPDQKSDLKLTRQLLEVKNRLLSVVGYTEKLTDASNANSIKDELAKRVDEDPRWKSALKKLFCAVETCAPEKPVSISYDKLLANKEFKRNLEDALIEEVSDSLSVDEMLYAQVIPNDRARTRLLSALFKKLKIDSQSAWSCQKTSSGFDFVTRVEVQYKNLSWASDTKPAGTYTQKSSQICFSSYTKIIDLCEATKGAPL